jgi:C1A family cysteine protease
MANIFFTITFLFMVSMGSRFFSSKNHPSFIVAQEVPTSTIDNYLDTEGNDDWHTFSSFLEKFHKKYDSFQELERRFSIFRQNVNTIILHNLNANKNFTMAINSFTDLTPDEFKETYLHQGKKLDTSSYGCKTFVPNVTSVTLSVPDSLDWREKGAVTSVKNQGQCGSCWAFSSTGAIEGAWAIAKGPLVDLSEQQLVDCATGVRYGSHGCSGGQMDGAFQYVITNGQCSLASYPYISAEGKEGTCHTCSAVARISTCFDVQPKNQASLKVAVSQQPVSIAIEADTRYFQFYSSGVLTSSDCGTNLDHGVLIVGYGVENTIPYWLVKNSWGDTWGEKGYVKIARSDSTNDAGVCGIAMMPSFPKV